jgi:hypothetical protein
VKKTRHTHYWAFLTSICRSSMAKGERTLSNGSGGRSTRPPRVSHSLSLAIIWYEDVTSILTGIGTKREDFSVTFSLSDVPEIDNFVAREEELAEIHRTIRGDGGRRTVVLHGLGGIGKTQLTIAYAKRHRDNYSAVFWLNIKDEDSLKQSFARKTLMR